MFGTKAADVLKQSLRLDGAHPYNRSPDLLKPHKDLEWVKLFRRTSE
jgi:hypothetical protein